MVSKRRKQQDAGGLGVDGVNVRVKDVSSSGQIDNVDRKIFAHFK